MKKSISIILFLMLLTVSVSVSFLASCSSNDDSVLNGGSESNSESESISVSTSNIENGGQPCYRIPRYNSYEKVIDAIIEDEREFPCDLVFIRVAEMMDTALEGMSPCEYIYIVYADYKDPTDIICFLTTWEIYMSSDKIYHSIDVHYTASGYEPFGERKTWEQIEGTNLYRSLKYDGEYSFSINEHYYCLITCKGYNEYSELEKYEKICQNIAKIINEQAS